MLVLKFIPKHNFKFNVMARREWKVEAKVEEEVEEEEEEEEKEEEEVESWTRERRKKTIQEHQNTGIAR